MLSIQKLIKTKRLNQKGFSHHLLLPIVVIAVVTVIGGYVIVRSHAQTLTPTTQATVTCTNPTFVTSKPFGGHTFGKYYVTNDMWNIAGYSVKQTLSACNYNNWYVVATMNNNKNDGAVKTYPNVHEDFNSVPISSFTQVYSSFAETSPHVGIYEYAYDMWINGEASKGSTEVMLWTENHGQVPGGSVVGSVTNSGHTYKIWKGGSYIAFVPTANFISGGINLLDFYKYIILKGWIAPTSVLSQVDYGVELVSTNNTPQTFKFTNFSVTSATK